MSAAYIYVVGQPDRKSGIVSAIHAAGYKAGLLLDTHLKDTDLKEYDRVERVDFSAINKELARLDTLDLHIAGLQCTFENYVVAKAKLGEYFNVASLSVHSARLATDKSLMRAAFLEADSSISPEFTTIDSVEQARAFASAHVFPLIIKPTNLVKSLLVLKCDNETQLVEKVTYALATIGELYKKYKIYERVPQLIIEEFITGDQFSIAAFVDHNGTPHFCDGIVRLKNAQDIGIDDNYLYSRTLPVQLPEAQVKEMFSVAEKGVRALGMRSVPAHIELMSGPQGTKIIEIGARIGGYRPRMYSYSYGVDLVAQEVKLALGEIPELEGNFKAYSAVYEIFPRIEGTFLAITGDFNPEFLTYYNLTATSGKKIGPAKNGYKAAAIMIVANSDKDVFTAFCQEVETARVEVA